MEATGFLLLLGVFALYMLPTIVAVLRHVRQKNAICVLNILLGWLFIPWVIALVWASMNEADRSGKKDDGIYYGGYSA